MKKTLPDDEFLDTLTNLFLADGVKRLTVGEIAALLRCSRRRLYDIAQTKEEIFCAMVQRFFQSVLDEGEALIQVEPNLTEAIAAYLGVGVQAGSRLGVQCLKDIEESEATRSIFDTYQHARIFKLSQLIDEGVRQGVFVPCHGLLVAEAILGGAMRLRRPAFLAQADLTIEAAFAEFYRLFLGGLLVDVAAPTEASKSPARQRQRSVNP